MPAATAMQNGKSSGTSSGTSTSTQSPQQQGTPSGSTYDKKEIDRASKALNCPKGKCAKTLLDAQFYFSKSNRLEAEKQQLQAQWASEKEQLRAENEQLQTQFQQLGELALELPQIHAAQAEEAAQQLEALKRELELEKEMRGALGVSRDADIKELEDAHQQQIQQFQTEVQGLRIENEALKVKLDVAHGMYARLQNKYEPTHVPADEQQEEEIVCLGAFQKSPSPVVSSTSAQSQASVKHKAENPDIDGNGSGQSSGQAGMVIAIEINAKVKGTPAQLQIPLAALVNDGGKAKQISPRSSIDSAIEENFAGCKITADGPPAVKKARQDSGEGNDSGVGMPIEISMEEESHNATSEEHSKSLIKPKCGVVANAVAVGATSQPNGAINSAGPSSAHHDQQMQAIQSSIAPHLRRLVNEYLEYLKEQTIHAADSGFALALVDSFIDVLAPQAGFVIYQRDKQQIRAQLETLTREFWRNSMNL